MRIRPRICPIRSGHFLRPCVEGRCCLGAGHDPCRVQSVVESIGKGGVMDMGQGRDFGIVPRRHRHAMADSELFHLAARAAIPLCLLRLAQPGKIQM